MKQIKFISNLLMMFLALIACGACSSDDPTSLKLDKDQSDKIVLGSNTKEGTISFYAPDAWHAYVDSQARSSEYIDWLHLETSGGGEGKAKITFTMDVNDTGESRTAYIIIVCDEATITITITQSWEENPDDPDDPDDIVGGSSYDSNMPLVFKSFFPVNIDRAFITMNTEGFVSQISGNVGNLKIDYNGPEVIAQSSHGFTYILVRGAQNQFCDQIVKYNSDNEIVTSYELVYSAGCLTKVIQYKDRRVYETSELIWENGDVTEVKTTYNGGYTITKFRYDDNPNRTNLMLFDSMMWIDLDEMEYFYYCGLLGFSTRHLIIASSSVEYEGGEEYKFSATYEYIYDSNYCPIKMFQREIEEGEGKSSRAYDFEWRKR